MGQFSQDLSGCVKIKVSYVSHPSLLDPERVMQAAERDAETRAVAEENLKAQKDATDEARWCSLLCPVVVRFPQMSFSLEGMQIISASGKSH